MVDVERKNQEHNLVWLNGRVGGKILFAETRSGEPAFSFGVHIDGSLGVVRARVNAYGDLAVKCRDLIRRNVRCAVVGELMNRSGRMGELTEVRAKDVSVLDGGQSGEG